MLQWRMENDLFESPRDSQWDTDITMAACTQLGYSDSGSKLAFVITVDKQIEVAP